MPASSNKPRFLLHWPSWATLVAVLVVSLLVCLRSSTDREDPSPWVSSLGILYGRSSEVHEGWPFRHSVGQLSANYSLPLTNRRILPLGLLGNVLVISWIVAGNVFIVESVCRRMTPPPRIRIALFLAIAAWVGIACTEANRRWTFTTNGEELDHNGEAVPWWDTWLAYTYLEAIVDLAPYFLMILPCYAAIVWLGMLWKPRKNKPPKTSESQT